jgi:hypothetical protein
MARLLAQRLEASLGQSTTGRVAAPQSGTKAVAIANPDGYTLLFSSQCRDQRAT